MDKIHENKLMHYRRIENIVRNIEETEAKSNEAIAAIYRKSQSNTTSIGPANDLLRYFYILEKQYQSDSSDVRTQARENVLEYFDQFRQFDDVTDEEEEKEEENNDDQQSDQSDEPQQPAPIVPSNPSPPAIVRPPSQSPTVIPSPTQPLTTVPSETQPSISLSTVTDPRHITRESLNEYEQVLLVAQRYEECFKSIDPPQKRQLALPIRDIINKLRQDTLQTLKEELFQYLNGHECKISNKTYRISNDQERLLCLSRLAKIILAQLLGRDLNDTKTNIFLPLVSELSGSQKHNEFGMIFRAELHKQCPYTVPLYPQRQPEMSDIDYLKAQGYVEKVGITPPCLETEPEFLDRMSGLIRLFCKLPVNRIPPFDQDLTFAWKWWAAVLNLLPRPNITCVLIRVFLDEAGEMMMKGYPMQFPKTIQTIRHNLSQIGKDTSESQIEQLKLALQKFPNQ